MKLNFCRIQGRFWELYVVLTRSFIGCSFYEKSSNLLNVTWAIHKLHHVLSPVSRKKQRLYHRKVVWECLAWNWVCKTWCSSFVNCHSQPIKIKIFDQTLQTCDNKSVSALSTHFNPRVLSTFLLQCS